MSAATWAEIVECPCGDRHPRMELHSLGLVCSRCGTHTGNNHQGHYWRLCKVTADLREFHFCCPGKCALGATS